jgi:hypothetical protein
MALVSVFLVLMLLSAMMVGFFTAISADQRASGIDRDQTQAYAAAHAGLEKLTSDLAALFLTDYSPSVTQLNNLMTYPPSIQGFSYTAPGGAPGSGYSITWTPDPTPGPNFGNPVPDSTTGTTITSGPYSGFKGIITRYPITVTARSTGGAEVRLRRELQTVAVPVFQFGIFSETDLTFWAGDNFTFGGRVQTNGNLFLSQRTGYTLNLLDRVTAFKEVVRQRFSNGLSVTANGFNGTVNIIDTTAGHLRHLGLTEGSVVDGPGSALTVGPPSWTTISTGTYKSLLRNGLTGAKYLSLPLVSQGAAPIDLIRRPPTATENTTNAIVFGQRYFSSASVRILLSDTDTEISNTNLPTVTATLPVPLDGTATAAQYGPISASRPPFPTSPGIVTMTTTSGSSTSQVNINAALPAYFKIPATISVGANAAVVCTGRTATTFTGCSGFTTAISAGQILTVTGIVPSGAGVITVSTSTTASQAAISVGQTGRTITATSTAAFAPTVFWLHAGDGGAFNCTGYNTSNQLTGCTNLSAAPLSGVTISTGALEPAGTTLNRGFIKIEMQTNTNPPVWQDVTTEILNLGVAGRANVAPAACDPTPDAVIRLYHVRDNAGGVCIANGNSSVNSNDYWPNVLYDTREGNYRDPSASSSDHAKALGGIMNYVALDVGNLKRWLAGDIGTSGSNVLNQNGFVVYFSDRRNNKNQATPAVETGEYGFEDVVNPTVSSGAPNGTLDVGEDMNAPTPPPVGYVPALDDYGKFPRYPIAGTVLDSTARPWTTTTFQWVGMVNRPVFFRRALKLINGGQGNLPTSGLTVAAENPVYVQGNYNATSSLVATESHQPAAVVADALTILSNSWNDANSFQAPNNRLGRVATTTGYRFAVAAGKSLSFPYPTLGSPMFLFGTDGGVANFLRYLEEWPSGTTIRYRGSIVSLFISRQATGTYKCCQRVYDYSAREYNFDTDFLLPALLPPSTPMFRDVNTLTFRQILRPNQ